MSNHTFHSVPNCTKCASIHPLISSLQHSEGEEPGPSQGHRALHHCGMMGSSCLCQPASQPGTARVHVAAVTLTERREEGTGAPLPRSNWYQMVPPLWGPDLRAGSVPGHLRAGLEDGQTAVFCQRAHGPQRSSLSAYTIIRQDAWSEARKVQHCTKPQHRFSDTLDLKTRKCSWDVPKPDTAGQRHNDHHDGI